MRFSAWFAILSAVLLAGQWVLTLTGGQAVELLARPLEWGVRLAAETLAVLALLLGGAGGLRRARWAKPALLVGLGMLVYSALTAAGAFAQQGRWLWALLYLLMVALAGLAIRLTAGGRARPAALHRWAEDHLPPKG